MYHLWFSRQAASPETFGYTLIMSLYWPCNIGIYLLLDWFRSIFIWIKKFCSFQTLSRSTHKLFTRGSSRTANIPCTKQLIELLQWKLSEPAEGAYLKQPTRAPEAQNDWLLHRRFAWEQNLPDKYKGLHPAWGEMGWVKWIIFRRDVHELQ
jgi:hypothetical protein